MNEDFWELSQHLTQIEFCRFLYRLTFGHVEKHFAHCFDYTKKKSISIFC